MFQGILKDKTRILVTHAVDFVNLADKIVIMKEGKIIAQGSPIELWAHPYLLEIQEIHDKNKQEIEAMNMEQDELIRKVSGSGLTLSDIDSDPEESKKPVEKTFGLTDEEIRAKLRKFSGADRGLDKQTEQVVGKLLLDEADEKVDADQETWTKLHGMIGGSMTILILGSTVTAFKYFEIYKQGVQQEWSDASPEDQSSQYSYYMSRIAIISVVSLCMNKVREILFQKAKRRIGRDVHRVTLKRVLLAPVNIFFDVTPLGKIVKIFMEDLNVFYGQVLDCPNAMFEMGSHLLVVLSMMFAIGNWHILVPMFTMMIYIGSKISKPYTYADN